MAKDKSKIASLTVKVAVFFHAVSFTCVVADQLHEVNKTVASHALSTFPLDNSLLESSLLTTEKLLTEISNKSTPSQDLFDNPVQMGHLTPVSPDSPSQVSNSTNEDYLLGKHSSLKECALLSLEPGEYEILPDGSLSVEAYNITYNGSLFFVLNGAAHFCDPLLYEHVEKFDTAKHLQQSSNLTLAGLIVSMVCLFLHLIVFVLVPELRNLPGWNLAALCLSLLFSYGLFSAISEVQGIPDLCFAVAILCHFFFMSSFMWMTIMSFDVYLSLLHVTGSLRMSSTRFKGKKFALYNVCAFGVAFLFALLGFLADILEGIPDGYRPHFKKTCWFGGKKPLLALFAAPVIVLTCLNFLFFVLSSCKIHQNKMKQDEDDHKSVLRRNYLTYFRLSVIMGVTWMVGIVAVIVHTDWLWILFVALNTLQGLYIFLAFTCNKKVQKFFRLKFLGGRRSSEQTLSPTFQSYCFYANSIEKDLDKIVDSKTKDSKAVIDTVVIHL